MGFIFTFFQNAWNNFFNPNAWLVQFENWIKFYNLTYDNSKTLATSVFSFNAIAVGQTTVNIIPQQQNPSSEHFMITAFAIFDGANAVLGETDWSQGISDALAKQGTLTIQNAGTTELFEFPLRELIPASGDSGSGKFVLLKPIMWKAQTNLSAFISFPTAPTTATYNVALDILGLKLI